MRWRIEVSDKLPQLSGLAQDIKDLGIDSVESIFFSQLYFLEGDFSASQIDRICSQLLADNITQNYCFLDERDKSFYAGCRIEVIFKDGVTDTVAENVFKGIADLDVSRRLAPVSVQTGRQYNFHFRSDQTSRQEKQYFLEVIATRLLANEVIESFDILI